MSALTSVRAARDFFACCYNAHNVLSHGTLTEQCGCVGQFAGESVGGRGPRSAVLSLPGESDAGRTTPTHVPSASPERQRLATCESRDSDCARPSRGDASRNLSGSRLQAHGTRPRCALPVSQARWALSAELQKASGRASNRCERATQQITAAVATANRCVCARAHWH